jgi:hypothetical protein
VLRDRAKQLGESVEGFPRGKLSDLIMGVSQEILDPSMRHLFQQEMEERIGNLTRR